MRIIKDLKKAKLNNTVIALGNFDGVHVGHKKLLSQAAKFAKTEGLTSVALTFDPHPQQVVSPERGLRLLTTLLEREEFIAASGIEVLVVLAFNERLRKLSYDKFIRRLLVEKLNVRKVFVGYDYAFGRGRGGDVRHLRAMGRELGFGVRVVRPVSALKGVVKSRIIRELLSKGKFSEALKMLGHPYVMTGRVVKGHGRGRELGFPTANLEVDDSKLIPSHGVYSGIVYFGVKKLKCAVNIGARPTFSGEGTVVEVHIPRFNGNLRGKRLKVYLYHRLREEKQFSDVCELKRQIARDVKRAMAQA